MFTNGILSNFSPFSHLVYRATEWDNFCKNESSETVGFLYVKYGQIYTTSFS